ncbi:MAG TPA: hypothetical protein VGK89_09855 [Candidatus Eisenbacteria bacterium]
MTPLLRTLSARYGARTRALALRLGLRAAAAVAAFLALAVAAGTLVAMGPAAASVRLAVVALAGLGAPAWAARAAARLSLGFDGYLERIEQRFPEVRSWLRNALDFERRAPRDTSEELAQALRAEAGRRLGSVPLEQLSPRLEPRAPGLVLGAALAVVLAMGVASPARVSRSWRTLWNPALAAPPVRMVIEPGSVRVTPGAALAVRARVWNTRQRPRIERGGPGVEAVPEGAAPGGERRWRFDLTQLTREEDYRVRAAGLASPTYHITMAGEPMPLSFEIEIQSPPYARLPVQRGAATRGDLAALKGARARLEITFDRDLEALEARLPGGAPGRFTALTPRRWQGEIPIEREGEYELRARAPRGEGRFRYPVTPLPDAPPVIAVRAPEGDLDLPAGQQVALEVLGEDDLGLSELRLQHRKDPAAPWTNVPLARFDGQPREAHFQGSWDASALGLLPGETASFRFELLDDNAVSGRSSTFSPTFELRFPSLAELYEHVDATQSGVQSTLEKVADKARELQKSLDRMSRQVAPRDAPPSAPAYERSEELKSALDRQQDMTRQIDEASERLRESIEQAAERDAFNQQMTAKLREMAELVEQIQSPEFREALKRMREALERLDRRPLEQQLPEWREQNRDMLENLERTLELLKQLRQEEKLESLAQRMKELQERQDALNREHGADSSGTRAENQDRAAEKEPPRDAGQQAERDQAQNGQQREGEREAEEAKARAEQQERAAQQTDELSRDVRAMDQELDSQDEKDELEQSASEMEQNASPAQREASRAAARLERQKAQQSGQRASQSLSRAAQHMMDMLARREQERAGADLAAVRRAAQDLVSLQREGESNLTSGAPTDQRADRQTDLSEGVARVADSLYTLAARTPFISPKLGAALGRAIGSLSSSGKELGGGNRQRGEDAGRTGNQALNEAVIELRQSESAMCQMPGNNPGGKQSRTMSQRMGEMGQRQGQVNRETRRIAQRLSEQMRMSSGDRGEMERLAQEQARIRQQMEELQREDEARKKLLGRLDQAQHEMKEVEEALHDGLADGETMQKQQRILSRMLDAQRSINRRDFDPERESRPGEDVARRSPAELPSDLLRETDRLRLDLLKAEADRYPAQYRAFIESYLRSLTGNRR